MCDIALGDATPENSYIEKLNKKILLFKCTFSLSKFYRKVKLVSCDISPDIMTTSFVCNSFGVVHG